MSQLEGYSLVIFDMDGTLYHQRGLQLTMGVLLVLNLLKGKKGAKELNIVLTFRKMRETVELTCDADEKIYGRLAKKYEVDEDYIKSVIKEWIYDRPLKYIPMFKNKKLIKCIKTLQKKGVSIAILSDYESKDKQTVLGIEDVRGFYSLQPEIGALKPSPNGITHIINAFGIEDKSKVIMVGDRMSKDGMAAINAGVNYLIV